ncbi:arsenate reductase (glutaredoxin) [Aestuariibacter salexigens]|uniref:arsenate reductase (glutaredoxin) n=1 Tax=Aestuariibacter salexigens TaxID=226010 RepID=UPI00047B4F77|nr:arsenate reductase (glutaredoxin) [Aestuariibacter salexigens]
MSQLSIYHNPRCSKSRQTLQLLSEHGQQPEVIEYLKTPLDITDVLALKDKLGVDSVRDFMRVKEAEYKELNLAKVEDEKALAKAITDHPKLLERPIVVKDGRAKIGRPPENVLELL